MAGLMKVRCVVPRFAQLLQRTNALTVPVIEQKSRNVIGKKTFVSTATLLKKQTVTLHFVDQDGHKLTAKAKLGDNLLDVIIDNDLDIDGFGACEGTLACSTCHLIFSKKDYESLGEEPSDEELDMLDLAYGLTDTSRLGCQIIVTKEMDGWEVHVPAGVADAREPS